MIGKAAPELTGRAAFLFDLDNPTMINFANLGGNLLRWLVISRASAIIYRVG